MDDSATICADVIDVDSKLSSKDGNDETKEIKRVTCKTQNFYVLLALLLITMALLIALSMCCYLIKYRAKQKHLLPFHNTKLKQGYINNIN